MSNADLLLAIDQGTTGTTSLVMDTSGATLGRATREFRQHFPAPGQVEHDADEIWESVRLAVAEPVRQTATTEDVPRSVQYVAIIEVHQLAREGARPLVRIRGSYQRFEPIGIDLRVVVQERHVLRAGGLYPRVDRHAEASILDEWQDPNLREVAVHERYRGVGGTVVDQHSLKVPERLEAERA